jgi:hypothetical protein
VYGFFSLSMSADGAVLASNAANGVRIWRVANRFEESTATEVASGAPEHPDVQVSPDGRWIARMGDGLRVFDVRDGSPVAPRLSTPDPSTACPWPQIRFSPDGLSLAGTDWGPNIEIRDAREIGAGGSLAPRLGLPTAGCDRGASVRVAFSPDGKTLATSAPAFYRTSDWQQIPPFPAGTTPQGFGPRDEVKWAPDGREILVSRGCQQRAGVAYSAPMVCTASAYAVSDGRRVETFRDLTAPFPSYSPEGHWMVAGGTLLHRPSGEARVFDPAAGVALFAPNGDIIAGDSDLTLTRYCRVAP